MYEITQYLQNYYTNSHAVLCQMLQIILENITDPKQKELYFVTKT